MTIAKEIRLIFINTYLIFKVHYMEYILSVVVLILAFSGIYFLGRALGAFASEGQMLGMVVFAGLFCSFWRVISITLKYKNQWKE